MGRKNKVWGIVYTVGTRSRFASFRTTAIAICEGKGGIMSRRVGIGSRRVGIVRRRVGMVRSWRIIGRRVRVVSRKVEVVRRVGIVSRGVRVSIGILIEWERIKVERRAAWGSVAGHRA